MSLDNQEYIEGLRQNNPVIIRKIYANYALKTKRFLIKKGASEADAKDVFQDALAIVFQKVQDNKLTLTSSFESYLIGVCKFIYANKRRKNAKTIVTNDDFTTYTATTDLERDYLEQEKYKIYTDNFSKLGTFCQTILKLYFDNQSMDFIAEKLNLKNAHTARNRKYRCQKELENFVKIDLRYKELKK